MLLMAALSPKSALWKEHMQLTKTTVCLRIKSTAVSPAREEYQLPEQDHHWGLKQGAQSVSTLKPQEQCEFCFAMG